MIDGRKLRAFRERRGVTQRQVASELGRSRQTVSQAERSVEVGYGIAERYLTAVCKLANIARSVKLVRDVRVEFGGLPVNDADAVRDADLVTELREVVS